MVDILDKDIQAILLSWHRKRRHWPACVDALLPYSTFFLDMPNDFSPDAARMVTHNTELKYFFA